MKPASIWRLPVHRSLTIGNGLIDKKLEMVRKLWEEDIKAEILYNLKGKVDRQLKYSLENGIPLIIWIGEEEAKNKVYNVKNLNKKSEEKVEEDINEAENTSTSESQVNEASETKTENTETETTQPEVDKKSARERLKDKGLM